MSRRELVTLTKDDIGVIKIGGDGQMAGPEVAQPEKKKKELNPEQLKKREDRKQKRAAKEAAFEKALAGSKQERPQVWTHLDGLINAVGALAQEEQNVTAQLLQRVFKNRMRPGRKAVSREKLQEKLAKLKAQQEKILAQLED